LTDEQMKKLNPITWAHSVCLHGDHPIAYCYPVLSNNPSARPRRTGGLCGDGSPRRDSGRELA
jgi:hypothetical protein